MSHNTRSKSPIAKAANLEILTKLASGDSSSSGEENSTLEVVKVVKVTPVNSNKKKTESSTAKKKAVQVVSRNKAAKDDKLKNEVSALRSLKKELEKEATAQKKKILQLERQNKANQKWETKFKNAKYDLEELKCQKRNFQAALDAKESQRKADVAAATLKAKKSENALTLKNNIQAGKISELKGLLDQQSREIINLNKREQANIQLEQRHAGYMMAEEHKKRAADQK